MYKFIYCLNLFTVWIFILYEFIYCMKMYIVWICILYEFAFCMKLYPVWICIQYEFVYCMNLYSVWNCILYEFVYWMKLSTSIVWIYILYEIVFLWICILYEFVQYTVWIYILYEIVFCMNLYAEWIRILCLHCTTPTLHLRHSNPHPTQPNQGVQSSAVKIFPKGRCTEVQIIVLYK